MISVSSIPFEPESDLSLPRLAIGQRSEEIGGRHGPLLGQDVVPVQEVEEIGINLEHVLLDLDPLGKPDVHARERREPPGVRTFGEPPAHRIV